VKKSAISCRRLIVLLLACTLVLLLVPPVLAADCPSGCSCLLPDDAKKLGYDLCSGKQVLCSYDSAQRPMYCYQTPVTLVAVTRTLVPVTATTAVPSTCPTGCDCLTDEQARLKYGTFGHCSETPCAKAVTGSTTLLAYCSKPTTPVYPACPSGCTCMNELQARERYGTYERCSNTQCAATTTATSNYPPYCYRQSVTPQPVCPSGCDCLTEAQAKAKFGENAYTRCSADVCGSEAMTTAAGVVSKYCFKPTPVTAVCPSGCDCLTEDQAKVKFGENAYSRCTATSCGSESMTTAAMVISKYCFQRSAAVLPATQCPSGCACMSEADAKGKGYPACRGVRTSCGYKEDQTPLFCFEVVPSTTCTYNYQNNACTGTCQQGYSCSMIAQEKDATGAVKYGVCGCQPPATGCAYNANLNACTGTCSEGTCVVTGKKTDASGAVTIVCGCESPACYFDYAKDACTGTCTAGTGVCQLNTIYRDTTGKTLYGECHCKGAEQTPVTVTVTKTTVTPTKTQQPGTAPCTCTAGTCTGSCPDGQICWMTATATDAIGKISCTECACKETCVLTAANECTGSCPDGTPCTRVVYRDEATGVEKVGCQCGGTTGAPAATTKAPGAAPNIVSAITSFFRSLFGMK
jgi:hypothetical protein